MFHLAFLLTLAAPVPKTDTAVLREPLTGPVSASSVNKSLLLQLVNDARKRGCKCGSTWYPSTSAVAWNDLLEKAALNHSTDMNQKKFFSHTSSAGSGAGPRIAAAGYNWKAYGENIAMGYADEKEVVAGWLKSPGHCSNIMSKEYKEMGAANVNGYWTQEFGTKD